MKRFILIFVVFLCGCAAWKAGINDPDILHHAISTIQPYKEIAEAAFPKAGVVVVAIFVPLLVLLGGRKKIKNEQPS